MKKVLILGASGFVGNYLVQELKSKNYIIYGADIKDTEEKDYEEFFKVDILNTIDIENVLELIKPDYIINLIAISSVKKSWDNPALTFDINVKGTINLLESVNKVSKSSRILLIGSSEEYGNIDYSSAVLEERSLRPINPYAISKLTQEKIANMYKETYGLDIVLTRSFNHIGIGQEKGFVVPDFISQLIEIEKGNKSCDLIVGNLSAERDFTDVRDVVRAYRLILEKGRCGEVYNVGSGKTLSIQNILDLLIELSNISVKVAVDKNKFRKIETPKIQSDISKIRSELGWEPQISIKDTLREMLEFERVKSSK